MKRMVFWITVVFCLLALAGCGKEGSGFVDTTEDPVKVISIVDTAKGTDIQISPAEEEFFEDDENVYMFSSRISRYIVVEYSDGSKKALRDALQDGDIVITDLDRFGISYSTVEKLEPVTLEVVRALAAKREALTREDLRTYADCPDDSYGEGRIQTSEGYCLCIHFELGADHPTYLYLYGKNGSNEYIDLWTQDIDLFVAQQEDE